MAQIKVAINGFGRIGRLLFRKLCADSHCEVIALNNLSRVEEMTYLLKYDSAQGHFNKEIHTEENVLVVEGKKSKIFSEKDPAQLPWKSLGVDVVVECSGAFTDLQKAYAHIDAGAKRVVISAPATGDLKTIVFNVNHKVLDGTEKIISAASCTTNCLAPMAQVLEETYGINLGFMTTIHAYTNDQNILDSSHRKGDFRRARAAASNIIPNSTGAAKAIGLVLPSLQGKLDGVAQRVPVITGSLTELVSVLNKQVKDVDEINMLMKKATNESFGYTEDPIVSSDVIGMTYGSLFDATQTKLLNAGNQQLVKTVSWYDNEMSYVSQLYRTTKYFVQL